ncbi:MAG: DUF4038 domain-containing protein [Chthoniobacteraceae bacterium]
MTAHPCQESSREAFGDPSWLAIDGAYSYESELFRPLRQCYQRRPIFPFVLFETIYEGEHESTPEQVRRQAWWAMLAGAGGQFLGNSPIWHFGGPGVFESKGTWQAALDSGGSRDIARLGKFFSALPWQDLVPDERNAFLTGGMGEGTATALASKTRDGQLAVVYAPSTGTQVRELTIALGALTPPASARWWNPTDGTSRPAHDGALPGQGAHTFRTPGDNGTQTNDWVLWIETEK